MCDYSFHKFSHIYKRKLENFEPHSRTQKIVRPSVGKHVIKHAALGEGMSEIENVILAEISADCSIRVSQSFVQ